MIIFRKMSISLTSLYINQSQFRGQQLQNNSENVDRLTVNYLSPAVPSSHSSSTTPLGTSYNGERTVKEHETGGMEVKNGGRCCFGKFELRIAVIGLGLAELLFSTYQLLACLVKFVSYAEHQESDLFCFIPYLLSTIIIALLLYGLFQRLPYLIVPHLALQLALLAATLAIDSLLLFWFFGGSNIKIIAIFNGESDSEEQGVDTSQTFPIEAHLTIKGIQLLVAILLIGFLLLTVIQFCLSLMVILTLKQLLSNEENVNDAEKCTSATELKSISMVSMNTESAGANGTRQQRQVVPPYYQNNDPSLTGPSQQIGAAPASQSEYANVSKIVGKTIEGRNSKTPDTWSGQTNRSCRPHFCHQY